MRAVALVALTGCSQVLGLEDFHRTDAAIDAMEVAVSGKVVENSNSADALADATITFKPSAGGMGHSTVSGSIGQYSLEVPVGTDGYLFVQHAGDEDTLQYLSAPITGPRQLTAQAFTPAYITQLATHGGTSQSNSGGFILLQIRDANDHDLAGATVTCSSGEIIYDGPNGPDSALTATDSGGIVTVFNVGPGTVTVSATFQTTTTAPRMVTVVGLSMTLLPILIP